jgi:hypothetical protein
MDRLTSRDYANRLRQLADWFDQRPEFPLPVDEGKMYDFFHYGNDKDGFLAAVRSLGSGAKEFSNDDVKFLPKIGEAFHFVLDAARSTVCRKVQEEKWECDPLFSQEEEAELAAPGKE